MSKKSLKANDRIWWMMKQLGVPVSTNFDTACEMIAKHFSIPLWGKTSGQRRHRLGKQIVLLRPDFPAGEVAKERRGIVKTVKPKRLRATPKIRTVRDGGPDEKMIKEFYASWEWKRLSYDAKQRLGRRCLCCGATPESGAVIHTDHVKPIRRFWNLRLDPNNLQILCQDCNMGKGSRDDTDWREENVVSLELIREQLKQRE